MQTLGLYKSLGLCRGVGARPCPLFERAALRWLVLLAGTEEAKLVTSGSAPPRWQPSARKRTPKGRGRHSQTCSSRRSNLPRAAMSGVAWTGGPIDPKTGEPRVDLISRNARRLP
jgi:hypothetical protein